MPGQSHPARLLLLALTIVFILPVWAGVAESIYARNPRLHETLARARTVSSPATGAVQIERAKLSAGDYFIHLSTIRLLSTPKPAVHW